MRKRRKIGKIPKLEFECIDLDSKDPWYEDLIWWIENKWKSIRAFFIGLLPNYLFNLIYYHKLMYKTHYWDASYLLAIEKRFFQRMLKRYESHKTMIEVEAENRRIRNLKLLIKLIDMMDDNSELDENAEVNMNNKYRFISRNIWKDQSDSEIDDKWSARVLVREQKIWHLYCLIRAYKFHELWD